MSSPLADSSVWTITYLSTAAIWMIFTTSEAARHSCIPGSRPRYRLATAARALAWPAATHPVVCIYRTMVESGYLNVLFTGLTLALWMAHFYRLRTDPDDDWFTRTGKRLRAWAKSIASSLAPRPAATPA